MRMQRSESEVRTRRTKTDRRRVRRVAAADPTQAPALLHRTDRSRTRQGGGRRYRRGGGRSEAAEKGQRPGRTSVAGIALSRLAFALRSPPATPALRRPLRIPAAATAAPAP